MYNRRIFSNKYLLLLILGIPFLLFVLYFFSFILPNITTFLSPETYIAEKHYSIKSQTIINNLTWFSASFNVSTLAVVYPLFIVLGLMNFKEDLSTFFLLGKHRMKHYSRQLLLTIIKYSFTIAVSFTLGHALFYLIFGLFTPMKTDTLLETAGYITNFMFSEKDFVGRPVLFFLLTVIVNDLPIIFSYSLFFAILTLYTQKNLYWYLTVPIALTFSGVYLTNLLPFDYFSLEIPFDGFYSKFSDVWLYTIFPLLGSITGFSYFVYRKKGVAYE